MKILLFGITNVGKTTFSYTTRLEQYLVTINKK